ncbi:hypothetical protein Rhow_006892 [Rhodococcus wratislaviensis]|uniref:Uncharacterized protein n=1 Tax=Rhodococcus wratislaviensis TaxID=44752 RepID=A0A402CGN2_RHOWR|nr:hypothetical protein [Rhodococcus wratislaviensis]GCE42763.1 hypothetical protein Rhow_006892 [Rhodococcus wratislaviensis]
MATTNLTPANALMKAFMNSGSRPAQADDVDQDVERILGRLRSTDVRKAVITGQDVQTDPHAGESDLNRFIRVMQGPQKPEEPEQSSMPLNGAQVLRAALGGGHGSVNGAATNSVAALISDQLSGRHDHSG